MKKIKSICTLAILLLAIATINTNAEQFEVTASQTDISTDTTNAYQPTPGFWHKVGTALTPIPTNSYYSASEVVLGVYGVYQTAPSLKGSTSEGIRLQYWTTTAIGAGIDLSYDNNSKQLTYTSATLNGRTVVGQFSYYIEIGTGYNLDTGSLVAQTGAGMTYQMSLKTELWIVPVHPRFFIEVQNVSSTKGVNFLFGVQQTF
jgi:hypothetical protein